MNVQQIVEAVLFSSDAPLTAGEIARADEMLDEDQVQDALTQLQAEYDDAGRAFEVVELAEGFQLLTRSEFDPYLERFDNVPRPSRLSAPALETLAIIAYRQPIGRLEVEYIRGVGSSGVIRTLQDRRLIDVVGRAEGLGRPLMYGTTRFFLDHFGFRSLEDLPRPEELPVVLRERIPLGLGDDDVEAEDDSGEPEPEDRAVEGVRNAAEPSDEAETSDEVEPADEAGTSVTSESSGTGGRAPEPNTGEPDEALEPDDAELPLV